MRTIIVPAWGTQIPSELGWEPYEVSVFREKENWNSSGSAKTFRNFYFPLDPREDDNVLVVDGRLRELPRRLRDVPVRRIVLAVDDHPSSPFVELKSGLYEDGKVRAEVETFICGGGYGYRIRVEAPDLETANDAFDTLTKGALNGCRI